MRCPYCGCNKLFLEKKQEGYNVKKGIAGTVVLGPVGAIAGINGNERTVFHCPLCGSDTTRPMDSEFSSEIDRAIRNNDTESLRYYKASYPNIEWNETVASMSTVNNPVMRANDTGVKEASKQANNVQLEIRQYLNTLGLPINLDEIINEMCGRGYSQKDVEASLLCLVEEGFIKNNEELFIIVRDIEEISNLKKKGASCMIQI